MAELQPVKGSAVNLQQTSSEKVKTTFESYARKFDRIYESAEHKSPLGRWIDNRFRRSMYVRFRETMRNLGMNNIQTILDVGCGSGRYCVEYLRMGKRVVGIDMASEMLRIAERVCKREFPDGQITFICANYLDHHFEDKFDAAVLMGLFDYIDDPGRLFKKLGSDVTKFIFASFPRSDNFLNAIRKVRYRYFKNCPLYYYSKEELERLMRTSGFSKYDIAENDREFYVKITL